MSGISETAPLPLSALVSLPFVTSIEQRGGSFRFEGERPGPDWHSHGYFARWLYLRDGAGRVVRRRLFKRRWRHRDSGRTCHSRPDFEVGALRASAVLICLELWCWLDSPHGLITARGAMSRRTRQRWLRHWSERGLEFQHAIRRALLERREPQRIEELFPGGVPPPPHLRAKKWRTPAGVAALWRAFSMLWRGARELTIQASVLLAEARRRDDTPDPFSRER